MRQLPISGLAATVAFALGAVAHAATTPSSNAVAQPLRLTGPAIAAPTSSSSGTTTTTTTTQAPQNTTTVDQRGQANRQAVAATFASGSTSSLGPLAATTTSFGNGTTSGTTAGTTIGGTGSGTTPGATTGGVAVFGNAGTTVGVPIIANAADVTFSGAPATTLAASSTTPTFTNADVLAQNGIVVTEAQVNGANVDRAIAQVQRDRKRIGRNGQLLYSIAPRTNVDRSAQMPDDPLPPALTGSNSTLTR